MKGPRITVRGFCTLGLSAITEEITRALLCLPDSRREELQNKTIIIQCQEEEEEIRGSLLMTLENYSLPAFDSVLIFGILTPAVDFVIPPIVSAVFQKSFERVCLPTGFRFRLTDRNKGPPFITECPGMHCNPISWGCTRTLLFISNYSKNNNPYINPTPISATIICVSVCPKFFFPSE